VSSRPQFGLAAKHVVERFGIELFETKLLLDDFRPSNARHGGNETITC
jgi:hypothetical protein